MIRCGREFLVEPLLGVAKRPACLALQSPVTFSNTADHVRLILIALEPRCRTAPAFAEP